MARRLRVSSAGVPEHLIPINKTAIIVLLVVGKADALIFWFTLACMFANSLWDFLGQFICGRRAGCKLSRRVPGAHCDDLLNITNNWMKNIIWRAASFYEICPYISPYGPSHGCSNFFQKNLWLFFGYFLVILSKWLKTKFKDKFRTYTVNMPPIFIILLVKTSCGYPHLFSLIFRPTPPGDNPPRPAPQDPIWLADFVASL